MASTIGEKVVPDRFLDAGEEPELALIPIDGYQTAPLVSLKKSIQPIQSLLYNADSMVEVAKRNSRKPADNLTPDESAAIHLYTMQWPKPHDSLFTLLNNNLRDQDRDSLIPWFLFLKLFLTALYKLPSFKGTIWRGVRGNLTDQYDEDQIWWGTSSCTETMEIMETFIGRKEARTIFNIECINGKAIRAHSYFKKENEIILMPGTYFKVVGKWNPATDFYMIQLRETTPPYETIASPFDLSSPSNNIPSLEKATISAKKKDISSENSVSAQSHKTKATTTIVSSPIFENPEFEQINLSKKNGSEPHSFNKNSANKDKKKVVGYAKQNEEGYASSDSYQQRILHHVQSDEYDRTWICVRNFLQLKSSDFEPMYDFDYNQASVPKTKLIGGYQCYLPIGWYRHAFRVIDKYPGDQRWIGSNNVKGEWPIAYHGTQATAIKSIVDHGLLTSYVKTDAMQSEAIEQKGEEVDKVGLYVTTHCNGGAYPAYTEMFEVLPSPKRSEYFRVVVQCRVRPHSFTRHRSPVCVGECWRIVDPTAVRPVAILVKNEKTEVPCDEEYN